MTLAVDKNPDLLFIISGWLNLEPAEPHEVREYLNQLTMGFWSDSYEESACTECTITIQYYNKEFRCKGYGEDRDSAFMDAINTLAEPKKRKMVTITVREEKPKEKPRGWDRSKYGCPATGKGLYAWMMNMETEFNIKLKNWFFDRNELKEFPKQLSDWTPEQVNDGWGLLVRKMIHLGIKVFDGMEPHEVPIPMSKKKILQEKQKAINELSNFDAEIPKDNPEADKLRDDIVLEVTPLLKKRDGETSTYAEVIAYMDKKVQESDLVRRGQKYGRFMMINNVSLLKEILESIKAYKKSLKQKPETGVHRRGR